MKSSLLKIAPIVLLLTVVSATAQNTVRKSVNESANQVALTAIDDSLPAIGCSPLFQPQLISIKGFEKRATDAKETMLVTNNTTYNISRVKVRFRYTNNETGELLHQRDEWLDCEIPAGTTRSVDIASFDRHRRFYYYLSPRSRRQATPFAVAIKILRYDIIATDSK
ncbi:MAG: hypothetical protein ACI4A8_10050 [Muribaculaceae bacterium]